ncbi:MAG: DUF971 domain-containing protein [Gammaproteobacteria bacterium]|nr:DUF971 domain-containing protein [Gammaproteobacteria bacterium]
MIPKEICLHQKSRILELLYSNGSLYKLSCEYLRVYSPSAEVRGHNPDQAVLQVEKKNVHIASIEPQGNYAIKLVFDDGHDTGIYSWDYLYDLAQHQDSYWQDYLARLESAGGRRESDIIASTSVRQWQP